MTEEGKPRPLLGAMFLIVALAIAVTGYYWFAHAGQNAAKNKRAQVGKEIMAAIGAGRDGDIKEAVKRLEAIVKQHPDNTDALFNYGVALGGVERLDDAETAFARILEINPKDYEAVAERAGIRVLKNDLDGAFKLLDTIPAGEGRIRHRLDGDPHWTNLGNDERMQKIRAKHGLGIMKYAH